MYRPKKKTQVLAHSRRQRENDTFTDIAQALPIHENAKDLDKASILRLAIHYLKLRDLIKDGGEGEGLEGLEEGEDGTESEGGLSSPQESLSDDPTALFQSEFSWRTEVFVYVSVENQPNMSDIYINSVPLIVCIELTCIKEVGFSLEILQF